MKENAVSEKSMAFAVRIVNLYKYLSSRRKEGVLSTQILRSGTSIGANMREANSAQSKADFIAKCCISLMHGINTSQNADIPHGDFIGYRIHPRNSFDVKGIHVGAKTIEGGLK